MSGVNVPCHEYNKMADYWRLIDLVANGYKSIECAPESVICKLDNECKESYCDRLKYLDFLPLFSQLVSLSAAMLTRKAITVVGDNNPIADHLENIDGLGNSIDVFMHDFLKEQLKYSIGFVMVDAPSIPVDADGATIPLSRKSVAELNLRPYWISIPVKDVIGYKFARNGIKHTLSQTRIRSTIREDDGDFGEKIIPVVKVFDLVDHYVRCRVFTPSKNGGKDKRRDSAEGDIFIEDPTRESRINLPYIPLFCLNTNPEDLWCARPDLYELAQLNINHTSTASDLRWSLHLAAHPKLKRLRNSDYQPDYSMGGSTVDMAPDKIIEADVGEDYVWLSAPSDSFAALERKIAKYESDAKTLWLATVQPQNTFAESGVSKSIGQNQGSSKLLRIAIAMESLLASCLQAHFDLMDFTKIGEKPPISLSVSRDLDVLAMSKELASVYSYMVEANQMTVETMLLLIKRGQLMPEDLDIQEEARRLEERQPIVDDPNPSPRRDRRRPRIGD